MRFSIIAAFATSLAVVSAQTPDLSSVPDCAITCLLAAIPGSGCGVTDATCQCTTGQAAITSSLQSCVPSRCSADDFAKVAPALAGICSAAGISVSVPASVATSTAASSVTSSIASQVSSAASAASSAASRISSVAVSATSSAPAQSTGGAAANVAGLSAVALGMVAALL